MWDPDDHDIVVRAIAEGRDLKQTRVGDLVSRELVTVSSRESIARPAHRGNREVDLDLTGMLVIGRTPAASLSDDPVVA